MIRAQYGLYICRIRRDNERSLGNQWNKWIKRKGIKDKPDPPHTKEPVGSGERAGGVIRPQALAIQLAANLPGDLLDRGGAGGGLGVVEDLALSLKSRCLNLLV